MTDSSTVCDPPKPSEPIYIPWNQGDEKWRVTWVRELIETTVNGCFKVSDKTDSLWIVKRFKSKDKGKIRAWKVLSAVTKILET